MSWRSEDRLMDLKSLPALEPRAELEPAVLAAMEQAAVQRAAQTGERPPSRSRYFARAAGLAAVAGIGALFASFAVRYEGPADRRSASIGDDQTYFELAEQSAHLDALLAVLPPPRRVMRAGTASTIVGLEDRIALIDAELYRSSLQSAPDDYRVALLRDRVEVMNALVNVRYAQSRAFLF
jgi:hypothetical protein